MKPETVLVLGASSQVGVFAIPGLLASGFHVVAVSRKPRPLWYPGFQGVHWVHCASQARAFDPVAILSAAPLDVIEMWLHDFPGITRVAATSTSSVISKVDSADVREKKLIHSIIRSEQKLQDLCQGRDLPLALLRPTLIYGCGLDQNISRLARFIDRFGVMPISAKATGKRQPLHATDLAQNLVASLTANEPVNIVSPLAGGNIVSYCEMVEQIFNAIGKPARILQIPGGLLQFMARLMGNPRSSGMRAEMVKRQQMDLVFEDALLRKLTGIPAREFKLRATDLSLPQADELVKLAGKDGAGETNHSLGSGQ